jgi:hypothetical protein
MSIELHILLHDDRAPDRDAWQREIERLAFPSVLDPSFNVRADTGFVPSTFRERVGGFEFYLTPVMDVLSSYPHIEPQIKGRNARRHKLNPMTGCQPPYQRLPRTVMDKVPRHIRQLAAAEQGTIKMEQRPKHLERKVRV